MQGGILMCQINTMVLQTKNKIKLFLNIYSQQQRSYVWKF